MAFRRGETNDDGRIDVSDAVGILGFLFLGNPEPPCLDAADVDDDGVILLTDAIGLLTHLFLGGPPPAAPGPLRCGADPAIDALSCEVGC